MNPNQPLFFLYGGGNGSVGERVEKAFGSGEDSGEIDMRVEGIDGRKVFVEAELDSGGDKPTV